MAVTELFQRLEEWRKANGRNPQHGSKLRQTEHSEVDDERLIVLALRMAAIRGRPDLRHHYKRIADELQSMMRGER